MNILKQQLGNGIELEMVSIPGGEFLMGSLQDESESPQHRVSVRPFYMGKFTITQEQWKEVASHSKGAINIDPSYSAGDKLPVESVSWDACNVFCRILSAISGRAYRLPTEAEWEYACRAGTTTDFCFGDTITLEQVNYMEEGGVGKSGTTPVGEFSTPNNFGLHDMHGNVLEWTQDVWHYSYQGAPNDGRAWETDGDPARRVLRGGAWILNAWYCRSAVRLRCTPELRSRYFGVRVVCEQY